MHYTAQSELALGTLLRDGVVNNNLPNNQNRVGIGHDYWATKSTSTVGIGVAADDLTTPTYLTPLSRHAAR